LVSSINTHLLWINSNAVAMIIVEYVLNYEGKM